MIGRDLRAPALLGAGILALAAACAPSAAPPVAGWPPRHGERYPDLAVVDAQGRQSRLSELGAGKVLLIEPIGMNCPACQAFAGGQPGASLGGVKPQAGLPSIEESFPRYTGGIALADDRVVYIQLLLYDLGMDAPDPEDARVWQSAFPSSLPNRRVLVPAEDMRGEASYALVPGFHLVDRSFVLRVDAAGHKPRHDLYRDLLPRVPALLDGPAGATAVLPDAAQIATAYAAIPHHQTTYRAGESPLPRTRSEPVERMLHLVDAAVALRMGALKAMRASIGRAWRRTSAGSTPSIASSRAWIWMRRRPSCGSSSAKLWRSTWPTSGI